MENLDFLREPMNMPDPNFPIKLDHTLSTEYGKNLFPKHWHDHLEFLFFTSGKALIECNLNPLTVQSGDLVVMNSNDLHQGTNLSGDLSYFVIIADPSLIQSQSFDLCETKYITPIRQNRILFQNKISGDQTINDCITSLIHEFEIRELGYELSIKSSLYQLLTLLLRKYTAKFFSASDYDTRLRKLEHLNPVLQYIDNHYSEKITVELLAEISQMSRFHFCRVFKKLTNRTVTEYVNQIRINKAESLLRSTTMSISEIATVTGFNDIYYFSRIFKELRDYPPSFIRKNQLID